MIFYWTKSEKFGSRLIRWGLEEDCSHFAVCFFEDSENPRVLESRLDSGFCDIQLSEFLGHGREIVHGLQFFDLGENETIIYNAMRESLKGAEYDSPAIVYWFFMGLARRLFRVALPPKNRWGKTEKVYCVEILQAIPGLLWELGVDIESFDLEMTSPHMIFDELRGSGLRDITGAAQCHK